MEATIETTENLIVQPYGQVKAALIISAHHQQTGLVT